MCRQEARRVRMVVRWRFDLTPYYGFAEDCVHWHAMAKAACDPYGCRCILI